MPGNAFSIPLDPVEQTWDLDHSKKSPGKHFFGFDFYADIFYHTT